MKGPFMTDQTIPPGFWRKANGDLVPVSRIKDLDKERHRVVTQLCEQAKAMQATLAAFKQATGESFDAFIQRSEAEYGVKPRGAKGKGNISLRSFDERYKVMRQIQDTLVFDERLQHAKALVDECIHEWGKGSRPEMKALVAHAFQVDKEGQINVGRVLSLLQYKIEDAKWRRAMDAIRDSTQVAHSKPHTRFYELDEQTGAYRAIVLDVAAL